MSRGTGLSAAYPCSPRGVWNAGPATNWVETLMRAVMMEGLTRASASNGALTAAMPSR